SARATSAAPSSYARCESSARRAAEPSNSARYSSGTRRPPCSQLTTTNGAAARSAPAAVPSSPAAAAGSAVERTAFRKRIAERAVDAHEVRAGRQDRAERAPDPRRQSAATEIVLEEALVAAFERAVSRRPVDQVLPELRKRCARTAEPERLEVSALADLGALPVPDRVIEEAHEVPRVPALERRAARPALVAEALQRADDRRRVRNVGGRALLHVEHADLDRHALEARDRAARIDPLVAQDAFRIVRREIGVDPRGGALLVLVDRPVRLRHDVARDR